MNDAILKGFMAELDKLSTIIRGPKSSGKGGSTNAPGGPRSHRPSGGFDPISKSGFDPTEAAMESREWAEEHKMRKERPVKSVAHEMGGEAPEESPVKKVLAKRRKP